MDDLSLGVPKGIVDALPDEEDTAGLDMQRAVAGWERRLADLVADEDWSGVVSVLERFEDRWERYDGFIVELRAWGQSPIYAMAWRDLYASLLTQVYDHADLADHIDRERNARIVEDGIRLQG